MKLQDYLHYYLGANVFLCYNLERNKVIDPLTYKMLHEDLDMFTDTDVSTNYKLLLRRLEDMTEEEAIELVKPVVHEDEYINISTYRHNLTNDLMVQWGLLTPMERADDVEYFFNATGERPWSAAQFHYLLSRHFDLFNLIDAGLAVNQKTINNEK